MSDDRSVDNVVFRRTGEVLESEIGDELVTLDVAAGDCFGFNEVARTVWRNLDEPRSFAQLRDALLADYDVEEEQCTADLRELLDDLVAKRLITSAAE